MEQFLTAPATKDEGVALAEFISTFKASLDIRLWNNLITEEAAEVIKAFSEETPEQQLKELADLRYVTIGAALIRSPYFQYIASEEDYDVNATMEAMYAEIIEKTKDSTFTVEQLQEAFSRVHTSNMSKLDDDGKPILREDGKILKGPNYQPPELEDILTDEQRHWNETVVKGGA